MQDRYAGDVGDFFKLGLLRWLTVPSPFVQPLRLGVIWFRVADESVDVDASQVAYLDRSSAIGQDLRPLDPHLYDRLGGLVASGDRSIRALVSSGVLPNDTVTYNEELTFADLSPNDAAGRVVRRERWFHAAMVAVDPCSLVFIDPDHGLRDDGRAVPSPRDEAEKHAYLSEVRQLLERGQSVVASHQVEPSDSATGQAMDSMGDIHDALGVEPLAVVRASRGTTRLFVVIPADHHRSALEASLGALQLSSWGDELRLYRWRKAVVAV
jgi:hypothetical protein